MRYEIESAQTMIVLPVNEFILTLKRRIKNNCWRTKVNGKPNKPWLSAFFDDHTKR
jgi:hypothetical protein